MYVLMEFNDLLVDVARVVEEDFFAQASAVNVDVDFGGGNAFVTEHLLYGTKVGSAFKQVCRKGVSQCVWADFAFDSGEVGKLFYDFENRNATDVCPFVI